MSTMDLIVGAVCLALVAAIGFEYTAAAERQQRGAVTAATKTPAPGTPVSGDYRLVAAGRGATLTAVGPDGTIRPVEQRGGRLVFGD